MLSSVGIEPGGRRARELAMALRAKGRKRDHELSLT
jgi:hypothetical protein